MSFTFKIQNNQYKFVPLNSAKMSDDSPDEPGMLENAEEVINALSKKLKDLFQFRDLFFENHPLTMAKDKNKIVDEKKNVLLKKFEEIDADNQIPQPLRAEFLYLKGRCYNISPEYDIRAMQCLSRAVKLDPNMVDAWNELGECYWKNMNVKDARASFEGALKQKKNPLSLRSLSIILRQDNPENKPKGAQAIKREIAQAVKKSVELAKEAVSQDLKDGISWSVLGNAYMCQFFLVQQDPALLKSCMSAYKQAEADPVARAQPDMYYNKGIALKYEECYEEALNSLDYAARLDPPWEQPKHELTKLVNYLKGTDDLVRTKGKVKTKKLQQMVQSIDKKMLGVYTPDKLHTLGTRKDVMLEQVPLSALQVGSNECKVVLGRVVGSIHNQGTVPFTFALVDESMQCVSVTVYNWADGRGAIIGDCVAIPEPTLAHHKLTSPLATYDFKSIRVNNPMLLVVNGKQIGRNQYATTMVTSTYEIH